MGKEGPHHRSIDHFRLIEIVKGYPALYDKSHLDYYNKIVKGNIWNKIDKKLQLTAGKSRVAWNSLKWSHLNHLRKKMSGDISTKKQKYEDALAFIHQDIQKRINGDGDELFGSDTDISILSSCSGDDKDKGDAKNRVSGSDDEVEFDESRLIELIKGEKCLYDIRNNDPQSKAQAWEYIAIVIGKSVSKCKKQWIRLKKQYKHFLDSYKKRDSKRVRWKYYNEMEFAKSYIEATCGRKPKKKSQKQPSSKVEFFASMASVVKRLSPTQQETIEAEILDVIMEAELTYKKKSTGTDSKTNQDASNKVDQDDTSAHNIITIDDDDEVIQRVKSDKDDNTSNDSCIIIENPTGESSNALPTEYVIKLMPKDKSTQNVQPTEGYIINVVPDNTDIAASEVKSQVKDEPINPQVKIEPLDS